MTVEFDEDVSKNYEVMFLPHRSQLRNLDLIGEFQENIKIEVFKMLDQEQEIKIISEKNKIIAGMKNKIFEFIVASKDLHLI